jgi:AcrR family transcriptional regulator
MPPKKGQRQARGLVRQDRILDAAYDLFSTQGVRTTTIATIADHVGLSEAGLLHHFPSKDALLLAVLERVDASFPDTEAWIAEPGGGLESLRRIPATAHLLADRPELTRLRAMVSAESMLQAGDVRRHTEERLDLVRQVIAATIAKGVHDGEIRGDADPATLAVQIVAFMEGVQIQWMLAPEAVDLVASYEQYFGRLVDQLAA